MGALEAMLVVTAATLVALLGAALFERHSARGRVDSWDGPVAPPRGLGCGTCAHSGN